MTVPPSNDECYRDLYSPLSLKDLLDQICVLGPKDQYLVEQRLDWVCSQLVSKVSPLCSIAKDQVDLWTNFTHFDDVRSNIDKISCDFLWYCWKCGVTVQTGHGQYGIDGILPIFVGNLDCMFAMEISSSSSSEPEAILDFNSIVACHMTYITWQVKNCEMQYYSSDPYEKLHRPKLIMADSPAITERGVLCLFFELGMEAMLQHSESPHRMAKVERWKPSKDEGQGSELNACLSQKQ